MRQLQLAQPAWAKLPMRPAGEGRVTDRDQASCQGLDLAFEGGRVSSAELHDERGLEGFSSLSQTTSVKLSEELEACILRKGWFTGNRVILDGAMTGISEWRKGRNALVILVLRIP